MTESLNKLEQKRALSREAYLQAGMHALQTPRATLDRLRAKELSARVDRTIGSFFNIWETQQEYKEELADRILSPENDIDYAVITAQTQESKELVSARRVWSSALIGGLVAQTTFYPRIAVYNTADIDESTDALLTNYYDRQQKKVSASLSDALGVSIEETQTSAIVLTSEDLVVRSMRGMIDPQAAVIATSCLIP